MRTISVYNAKGGVGKTTVSVNLAGALARRGRRVLLVDTDLQGNASRIARCEQPRPTLSDVFLHGIPFSEAIHAVAPAGFDLVPADPNLDQAAQQLLFKPGLLFALRKGLRQISAGYDFCFIDHSPNLTPITLAGLLASEELVVPLELSPYAVDGLQMVMTKVSEALDNAEHGLSLVAVVPIALDRRLKMAREYLEALRQHPDYGPLVTPPIRTDANIPWSQEHDQTIFEFAPNSKAAVDFIRVAEWLEKGGVMAA